MTPDQVSGVQSGLQMRAEKVAEEIRLHAEGNRMGQLMKDMFTWLRTRYVISYTPPPGKGWHPVSVNRRGAKVTAREGYFVD